ncbi:MAG: 50S ribosomal protein L2, partial [Pelagibacteraceae bacterium]
MALKSFKPYTKSTRSTILVDRSDLWKGKPEKSLTKFKKRAVGRNNQGRITTRHKMMGHKKRYRLIDFKRSKNDIPAEVKRFEYDPFRSANIMLIEYQDKVLSYVLGVEGLKIGDKVVSGDKTEVQKGNSMMLKNIPAGTSVHNIELTPGKGGILARSAGSSATVMGQDDDYTLIKLGSGETRKILSKCKATIGQVSNVDNKNKKIGKAGRNRWLGKRPTVRGVVMNPVDHPHGGGEGKTSGGRNPVTPWGQGTRGLKTRNNKKTDQFIISRKK